jgi:hypothetical protein
MANRYSVPLKYSVNSNSHSNFKFEGKIKFIAVTYTLHTDITNKHCHNSECNVLLYIGLTSAEGQ